MTVILILAIQVFAKGFLSSIAVLLGLIVGSLVAALLGVVSLEPLKEAAWFHVPQPFYFGVPHFEWSSSVTMIIIALVSMVESTGVYFALGDILNKKITEKDLKLGYRAEGLAVVLGGIFNTFPYTTFFTKCWSIRTFRDQDSETDLLVSYFIDVTRSFT